MQHLLSARLELLLLFHSESAEARHLLGKITPSVCLSSIHHLARIRNPALITFIGLAGVGLGHLRLHVVSFMISLYFFSYFVHLMT
jgi:hypothetical protein